ncbi:SDR family NAD(P)-dependent oxidoreductase [Herpetosiphon geysericola]|uniref:SDR family NAD(P)-dependent oxidoreductase n=1 Tax=Herpetosiphon geysericola TaxID=70996 RepID=UPI0006C92557|nr:SDR family NAD(P)-dependent oxidoreductase [Herpetosiphon geysericola]
MPSVQTILVTGSSSGLGRAIVETLAQHGHMVFASMRGINAKNAQAAQELRDFASQRGLTIEPIELDVTNQASVDQALATIQAKAGRLDCLVNNAGAGLAGLAEACSIEQVQQLFEINVFGAFRVTKAVLPLMRQQQAGVLITISSTSTQIVVPLLAAYGASKAAEENLAQGMAYELTALGIDSVILQLGGYATKFGANIQVAANQGLNADYGVAGHYAQAISTGIVTGLEHADNPVDVGNKIHEILGLPSELRPRKYSMGTGSQGLNELNQQLEPLQAGLISMMNMEPMLLRSQTVAS